MLTDTQNGMVSMRGSGARVAIISLASGQDEPPKD